MLILSWLINVSVIFRNLRGCDIHLFIKETGNFDLKVNIIPNGLEKYMSFVMNWNFVFIDCMQFMNSGLDELVKNLSDNDLYLSQEIIGNFLKLVKQRGVYPYE